MTDAVVAPRGFSHVRLTVTDIHRSKAFSPRLLDDVDLELAAPHPDTRA